VQFGASSAVLFAEGLAPNVVDTRTWSVRQLARAHPQQLDAFGAASLDGSLLATTSADNLLRVWSVGNGAELGSVPVSIGTQSASWASWLAFARDGARIVAVDSGTEIRMFSSPGLQQLWTASAPSMVGWVGFSADGMTMFASLSGQLMRLDVSTGATESPITIPGATGPAAISGDGQVLAVASSGGMAIVRASDGTILRTLTSTFGEPVALSQDGAMLATADSSGQVTVTDASTGTVLRSFQSFVTALAFSPDGSLLASASAVRNVVVWRLSDGSIAYEGGGQDGAAMSPAANLLASRTASEATFIWDLSSGALTRRIPVTNTADLPGLSFDTRGELLIDGFYNGEIWDLSQGASTTINYTPAAQPPVAISPGSLITPDGQWIVSGGNGTNGGAVRVWSAATGTLVRGFDTEDIGITALAVDSSGTLVATGTSANGQPYDVKIWDFASGTRLQRLHGHTQMVMNLAFSPDGSALLSGGFDGLVRLWSTADGSVIRDFESPPNPSPPVPQFGTGMAFSPNGRFVAVESDPDGAAIHIWSVATGELVRRLEAWGGPAGTPAGWSSDGQFLATTGAHYVWCVGDLGGAAPSAAAP
jgi:WD40 repeat protein